MDQGVKAAISEAYRVFSRYSFGTSGAAPCEPGSLGPLEERLLRMTPVPEVPPELIAAHAGSLAETIEGTTTDDFRALLPRYFELIAADGGPVNGWKQDAFRGLARSEYRKQWPAEEADAVDRLLGALLLAAEARGASGEVREIREFLAEAQGSALAARQEA